MDQVEGIVLKEQTYGETSKILQVLTLEHGLIGVMAKGARSLKSPNRSTTTKLTYGIFNLYYKEGKLSTLKNVDVINPLKQIKKDLTKISFSMFLLDLTEQIAKQCYNEKIYTILKQALLRIEEGQDPMVITNIVELKYLDFLGVMPVLNECSICGNTSGIATLSAWRGGYVCSNCLTTEHLVNEKSIKLIRMFYYVDLEKLSKTDVSEKVKLEVNQFLDEYYERYTGLYLKSKNFLRDINKVS